MFVRVTAASGSVMVVMLSVLMLVGSTMVLAYEPYERNHANTEIKTNPVQVPGVVMVSQRMAGATVVLGGSVIPRKEVTLSAQISGRVEFVGGREGDIFRAGELLAVIDDDDLDAQRRQAMANLRSTAYAARDAQMQYGREFWSPQSRNVNQMPGMGLPSLFDQIFTRPFASNMGYGNPWLDRYVDLYGYNSKLHQARSRQYSARAQVDAVDARFRDSRSITPFNGVIIKKLVNIGDTVQPGHPLFRFADLNDMQIVVNVPIRLISGVREGMLVTAMLDSSNTFFEVRVAQVYPMGDTNRHTVPVKFDLPVDAKAWPGIYAEVMLADTRVKPRMVLEVPESAVAYRGSLPAVFVQNSRNEQELRLIRLGQRLRSGYVSVLSGLRPGDLVVTRAKAVRAR